MADFDVIVIGGGPGGYIAAIRCAQLGLKTACVDERLDDGGKPSLGGVCLNVGCIPSKALLDTTHHYYRAQHEFAAHGIGIKDLDIDIATMMARKNKVVKTLTDGIAMLFVKHKITWFKGRGELAGENRIRVSLHNEDESKEYKTNHIIIATGSSPVMPDAIPDDEKITDSTGALAFEAVPKRLAIIGGGVIGLELGSVWTRLGSKTSIIVRGDKFLKNVDQQIAKAVQQDLEKQGMNILLGAKLVSVKPGKKNVSITCATADGETKLIVDKVLVATGRTPNTTGIGADVVGLTLDAHGFIEVDAECRSNLPNVFAIGDVVRGPMLAHKASEEGVAVAERIAGQQPEVNYTVIPSVVYTWPELAWAGLTAEQLQLAGTRYKSGVFPFTASGRAHASGDTRGMVKILSDASTDQILGVHIYGPNASELISEAVVAMEYSASAEDLARIVHAHPTLSEAVHEAALAVDGRSLHS
ncbi:MAG: dihydrolipoyl dehydrogenase [Gammaproteobacteria bacterium]|nr:dihydrolipoyl dehydrogenase [Gammaproteobacteria bacterium]